MDQLIVTRDMWIKIIICMHAYMWHFDLHILAPVKIFTINTTKIEQTLFIWSESIRILGKPEDIDGEMTGCHYLLDVSWHIMKTGAVKGLAVITF